jgi:hypothetical protein
MERVAPVPSISGVGTEAEGLEALIPALLTGDNVWSAAGPQEV